jgi:hypothetical protein
MDPVVDPAGEPAADSELAARLATAPPEERERLLVAAVLERAAAILDRPSLADDSNFLENGLSSLAALELAKSLMAASGVEVPVVAVVEYPTPTLLGKYLAEEYEAADGDAV